MARIDLHLHNAMGVYKQTLYRAILERRLNNPHVTTIPKDDILNALSDSTHEAAMLIASLFKGVRAIEFVAQHQDWQLFEQADFWFKSLIVEVATATQVTRNQARPAVDPGGRSNTSIQSFAIVHDINTILGQT